MLLAKWEIRKNTKYENFKVSFRQKCPAIFCHVLLEIWDGKSEPFFHSQNFADMTPILIYILQGCLHLNSVLTVIIFHY